MIRPFCRTIVRLSASLAPRAIRARWREEWLAEIGASQTSPAHLLARTAGAPLDALSARWTTGERMRWRGPSRSDFKLAVRMLVKYPGLTIVGGLAMAFAICVGTVIVQVLSLYMYPSVPLPRADRLVQIRNWDVAANDARPPALYDFLEWRSTVKSLTELGAWRDVTRNLVVDGNPRPVQVAEITASAFRVADATPLMGRVLTEADERPGARPVVVIGYDIWRTRFGSDPGVIGKSAQLGTEHVIVTGVMREGFEFPVAHDVWTPMRSVNDALALRPGPSISVFGLLAPGATLDTAQAELTVAGQRAASEQPATHAHLQPFVAPYAVPEGGLGNDVLGIFASIYFFAVMLLILICSNIALLLFARAATREAEITMRTALGASRGRIVAQIFAEALVLGGVSAVVGLAAAYVVLTNWGRPFLEANLGRLPFWYDLSLAPTTVMAALGLTMLGSAIAGVIPALKVTRGLSMGARLKQATPGAGGLQFGGIWTGVIIAQVAVTVAFPAIVYQEQWQLRHAEHFEAGFSAEEYLAARIELDTPSRTEEITETTREADRAAFSARLEELRQRVAAEPEVAGVTFVSRVPRDSHPMAWIDLAEDANHQGPVGGLDDPHAPLRLATVARIDPSYFDVLDTRVLAGRAFTAADIGTNVAIVDQGFVDQVLQGRNPVGQQLRFRSRSTDPSAAQNPWREIVGVVKELGMGTPTRVGRAAGLYLPARPERLDQVHMVLHLRADPLTFAPELREIAAAVDPALRLSQVQRLDQVTDALIWVVRLFLRVTLVMTVIAIVLSLSGIYAVLSFIVARRTREIGIRVALGADRLRIIGAIFRKPLIQVGLGVLAGSVLLGFMGSIETEMPGLDGELSAGQWAILAGYGVVMLGVCLLACIVPTRRALGVEPTVALRVD